MRELKSIALSLLICVSVSRTAAAATYVTPVATARLGERVYSTTLAFGNARPTAVRCEASYTPPGSDGTFRATYEIPPASVLVENDTLREAGAIGVMHLDCAEELVIASRIHRSVDGGRTFDGGRVFEAVHPDDPAATRRSLITTTDVVVMEVAGFKSVLTVRARTAPGAAPIEQEYELPAFGQQLVNLSSFRDGISPVHLELSLDSAKTQIAIAPASTDPVVLSMTRPRPAPSTTSATATTALRDVTSASFKAAPFRDPATGLVYMRDRWYDPSTGTFITPDPEGFADSANPYAYCGGDPVNCSDPTGRAASVSKSGVVIGIRPDGSRYRIGPRTDPVVALRVLESDPDLGFDEQEDIMTRAGITIPYSSACRPGESCIRAGAPNLRAFEHAPRGDMWDYGQGAAMAAGNMLTAPGGALTRDAAYVGFEPRTREQRFGADAANLTAAVIGTGAAARQFLAFRSQVAGVPEDPVPLVEATFEHAGSTYYDVNPTARDPVFRSHLEIEGLAGPNKTMANAHAEISAMSQSLDAGNSGGSAVLRIRGLSVCAYCKGAIKAMARQLKLEKLTVIDETTGQIYEFVGDELSPMPKGKGWKQ